MKNILGTFLHTGLDGYYTVLVPWSDKPTPWHPTDRVGPFSVLCRGAFAYPYLAHAWAHARLEGQPYTLRYTPAHEVKADY